jgi:hypothetical protein
MNSDDQLKLMYNIVGDLVYEYTELYGYINYTTISSLISGMILNKEINVSYKTYQSGFYTIITRLQNDGVIIRKNNELDNSLFESTKLFKNLKKLNI